MKKIIPLLALLFFSCSSNRFAGSNSISAEELDVIKTAKEGYSVFVNENNRLKADSLFAKALDLSEKIDYPYTNGQQLGKYAEKIRENRSEDWNGSFEQKTYTLLKVYNGIRLDYAGFGVLTDFDWKDKVVEYFPKLIESKDSYQYTNYLRELISLLNDNHTSIHFSPEFSKGIKINVPPLEVDCINGKFIITKIDSDSPKTLIYPGLEILTVDGIKPIKILEDYKKIGFFSKIEKERNYRAVISLRGKEGSDAVLLVYDKVKDEKFKVKIKRDKKNWYPTNFFESVHLKKEKILYFKFNSFAKPDSILIPFRKELKKHDLSKISGIVFDIRDNGGGSSYTGNEVISHLINKNIKYRYKAKISSIKKKGINILFKTILFFKSFSSDWLDECFKIRPNSKYRYNGKVALLVSGKTGSAAEDFAALIKENKIGKIFGEPTSGSTGDGIYYSLPEYNFLRVCMAMGIYCSGEIWQGKGILPDIEVTNTVESLLEGRDIVYDKALEYILN